MRSLPCLAALTEVNENAVREETAQRCDESDHDRDTREDVHHPCYDQQEREQKEIQPPVSAQFVHVAYLISSQDSAATKP